MPYLFVILTINPHNTTRWFQQQVIKKRERRQSLVIQFIRRSLGYDFILLFTLNNTNYTATLFNNNNNNNNNNNFSKFCYILSGCFFMLSVFIHHVSTKVQAGDLLVELALLGGSKSGGQMGWSTCCKAGLRLPQTHKDSPLPNTIQIS